MPTIAMILQSLELRNCGDSKCNFDTLKTKSKFTHPLVFVVFDLRLSLHIFTSQKSLPGRWYQGQGLSHVTQCCIPPGWGYGLSIVVNSNNDAKEGYRWLANAIADSGF